MSTPLFQSDRPFALLTYTRSHGLLLLRSGKPNPSSKRIDVLFQDVRAMEIRAWFEGIEIAETDAKYLENRMSVPSEMLEFGNRIYALKGVGWSGFIVGGIVSVLEDDGEFWEPSGLLSQA
jgi:hypothetical protein